MPAQETLLIRSDHDVRHALQEIGLSRQIVVDVARAAAAARAEALSIDPLSAAGSLSYIYGVRAIRLSLIPNGWRINRIGNVESTINDELAVQIFFQNVDIACNEFRIPHAISRKGPASRELISACHEDLFDNIREENASKYGSKPTVWLLCVSSDDVSIRAEISCPTTFQGIQFEGFHKRIFVLNETYDPSPARRELEENESAVFDVSISKK